MNSCATARPGTWEHALLLAVLGAGLTAGCASRSPLPSPALALPPGGTSRSAEVQHLIQERLDAASRGDVLRWRRHLSPDCLWSGPNLANASTADAEREVAANASLPAKSLEIRDFEMRQFGDVVIATYVALEANPGDGQPAKRFRKTDTYLHRANDWQLISAVEVYVPFRAVAAADPRHFTSLEGEFELDAHHQVRVWRDGNQLLSQGTGESHPTRLLPANVNADTFFVDGEIGEWVFPRGTDDRVQHLIYRLAGKDILLRRKR